MASLALPYFSQDGGIYAALKQELTELKEQLSAAKAFS